MIVGLALAYVSIGVGIAGLEIASTFDHPRAVEFSWRRQWWQFAGWPFVVLLGIYVAVFSTYERVTRRGR